MGNNQNIQMCHIHMMRIKLMQIATQSCQETGNAIVDIQTSFSIWKSKKETAKSTTFCFGCSDLFGILYP